MVRKVTDKDRIGKESWGQTIKYLNAVCRLSCKSKEYHFVPFKEDAIKYVFREVKPAGPG